ncbi:MAG: tRNA (guanosine(37)-N1)-methyltransferase TrmD [Bdellovibrionales bacterium]
MQFNIVTLFPEFIADSCKYGLVGQAIQSGIVKLKSVNPRNFTQDVHHTVDGRPFGGGDGMIMSCEPLEKSLEQLGRDTGYKVLLSAQGAKWTDQKARQWAEEIKTPITLICGRYGGVDQRFINTSVDEEVSIGDYILSGGELGALVIVDSVSRLLPEVLGNPKSIEFESFADGLLEAPQFTRPQDYQGVKVPKIFLSGDHSKIEAAKKALSLWVTLEKRPDLITAEMQPQIALTMCIWNTFSEEELRICGIKNMQLIREYGGKS